MKTYILVLSFLGTLVSGYFFISSLDNVKSFDQWLMLLLIFLLLAICLLGIVFGMDKVIHIARKKKT